MHLHACGECKLPRAEGGCLGVWHSLHPLRVSGCCWDPLRYVPDSSCSCFVPRVFLALVEEAEDRGGVVAQGGGKVRVQALLCCWPVPRSGLWGGLGLCRGGSCLARITLAPSYRRLGEAGAAVTWLQDWLLYLCMQALIPLSLEGTEVGQTKAAQALAKITITSNPEMAFPGERVSVTAVGWGSAKQGSCSQRCTGACMGAAAGTWLQLGLKATGLVGQGGICAAELPAWFSPSLGCGRWQDPWCSLQRPNG